MANNTINVDFLSNAAAFAQQMEQLGKRMAEFSEKTTRATKEAEKLAHQTRAAGAFAGEAGRIFQSAALGVASFFAVHQVREWTSALVESSSKFEQLKLSIAGSISGTGGASFAASQVIAEKRIAGLMEAAKVQVGTNEDYFRVYQQMLAPGRAAHATSEEVMKLTNRLVPVVLQTEGKEGISQIGRQVSEVLTRGININLAPTVGRIIREAGMSFEQFNKIRPENRIGALTNALGGFKEMVKAGESTWEAASSTLVSNLALVGREAGKPVFDFWKNSVVELNDLMEKNKDTIHDWAMAAGGKTATALRVARDGGNIVANNSGWGSYAVGGLAAGYGMSRLVSGVGAAAAAFEGAGGLAGIAGTAAAALTNLSLPVRLVTAELTIAATVIGNLMSRLWTQEEAAIRAQTTADASALALSAAQQIAARGGLAKVGGQPLGTAFDDFAKQGSASKYANIIYDWSNKLGNGGAQQVASYANPAIMAKVLSNLGNPAEARMHQSKPAEVNVKITMDVRDVRDPDRLASITAKKLAEFVKAPTQGHNGRPVKGM